MSFHLKSQNLLMVLNEDFLYFGKMESRYKKEHDGLATVFERIQDKLY